MNFFRAMMQSQHAQPDVICFTAMMDAFVKDKKFHEGNYNLI